MLRFYVKTAGVAASLVLGLAQGAAAHGPTRKKVVETVTINAAPDKVWKIVGNFQDMSWLPGVKSTTGTGGNEVDAKNSDNEVAKRTITLANGGTVNEGLYKYDVAAHSYSYRIDKVDVNVLPVNDYSSTISVDSTDGGKTSTVEWRGAFYRGYMNNDPPPNLTDEASVAAVRGLYKSGLEGLKKKVEAQG